MLKNSYDLADTLIDNIIDDLYDSYGIENADIILNKVCDKVFTIRGDEKVKKPLPDWTQDKD